jgi:serine phosphatase RsbU (regulator of sigma subunit)/DNA-binding response OmpR family regulator/anti-sigma regulatory factor (Ser/Thr protein kinase)
VSEPAVPRILVVDSLEANRYLVSGHLRRAGFATVEAADGEEALRVVATEPIDLVVLDGHLPDVDGFEVRRRIRAEATNPDLPVLHLSATSGQDRRAAALEDSAAGYLLHPVEPAVLVATVRALLRASDSRKASHVMATELAVERNRLRAILRQLPIGMLVVNADSSVVLANTEGAEILGRDAITTGAPDPFREQRLIRIDGQEADPRTLPVARALAGAEVFGAEYLMVRPDGTQLHLRANAAPIREEDGSVSGAILTFVDITERARTDLALRLLADLAEPLAAVSDLRRDLPEAARLVSPAFADRCDVVLRRDDGRVDWLGEHRQTPDLERVGAGRLATLVRQVITDGTELFRPNGLEVSPGTPGAGDSIPGRVRSLVAVPVPGPGRPVGALVLANVETERRFSTADIAVARRLAERFASAIQQFRLTEALQDQYETEHRVAAILQRSLLPDRLPGIPGVELTGAYHAGTAGVEVGGDWYDVIPVDVARVGLVIGDVIGRGPRAATTMGQIRHALRAFALLDMAPDLVLTHLNRYARLSVPGEIATVAYLILDRATGTVTYSTAGHPPPVVVAPDGSTRWLDEAPGPLLGAFSHFPASLATARLEPEECLVLYTDGLVERREEGLGASLERLARTVSGLVRMSLPAFMTTVVDALSSPEGQRDDIAVLLARMEPVVDELRLDLPARPESVAACRFELRRWLAHHDVDGETMGDLVLATCEAISNAIVHGYGGAAGSVRTRARLDGSEVVIEVTDTGRWRDRSSANGRGLDLMHQLARADVETGPLGTTVTLRRSV